MHSASSQKLRTKFDNADYCGSFDSNTIQHSGSIFVNEHIQVI